MNLAIATFRCLRASLRYARDPEWPGQWKSPLFALRAEWRARIAWLFGYAVRTYTINDDRFVYRAGPRWTNIECPPSTKDDRLYVPRRELGI